jgi:hypothetical protein
MKPLSKVLFPLAAVLPQVAAAHPGHAPLGGLPDLLLHQPWLAVLVLVAGCAGLRLLGARRARARTRRR